MTAQTKTESAVKSYDKLFLGGTWQSSSGTDVIEVISPATEQVIATVPSATNEDMDQAVAAARKAFDEGPWPRMTPGERATVLSRVHDEFAKRLEQFNEIFTAEVGAPTAISSALNTSAVGLWERASTLHEDFVFSEERTWATGHGKLVKEPIGVVGVILPWNGPMALNALKAGPALAAGCTVVVKPSTDGPLTHMLLSEVFEAAGFPEGVVSVLPAEREVGEHLVRNPDVDMVTFTGSTAAGRRIMGICSERIARVSLELGGKSAAVIADDIPLDKVFPELVFFGIAHSGQVCSALTRILVPRDRQEEVVAAMKQVMEATPVGDPTDPGTALGPLAMERQRQRVEDYIQVGQAEGARLVSGGERPDGTASGWYVKPTLFADVTPDMRVAREEIFGPVLCVMPFDDIDDAVRIANDSQYGLSGAVYANDTELAEQVAARIRTGQVSINSWDANLYQPYGGYKQSGLGREGGVEGFEEFFESKMVQYPTASIL